MSSEIHLPLPQSMHPPNLVLSSGLYFPCARVTDMYHHTCKSTPTLPVLHLSSCLPREYGRSWSPGFSTACPTFQPHLQPLCPGKGPFLAWKSWPCSKLSWWPPSLSSCLPFGLCCTQTIYFHITHANDCWFCSASSNITAPCKTPWVCVYFILLVLICLSLT